jgi:hypothetical protein
VKRYESVTFRQRYLALSEDIRNHIYDYVIAGDVEEEWSFVVKCGSGFSDCSLGVISLDGGGSSDAGFHEDVRLYSALYESFCTNNI